MKINDRDIILSQEVKGDISLDSRLQAIQRFERMDFGDVTDYEESKNIKSIKNKKGNAYGIYMTPDGDTFILNYDFQQEQAFIYLSYENSFWDIRSVN